MSRPAIFLREVKDFREPLACQMTAGRYSDNVHQTLDILAKHHRQKIPRQHAALGEHLPEACPKLLHIPCILIRQKKLRDKSMQSNSNRSVVGYDYVGLQTCGQADMLMWQCSQRSATFMRHSMHCDISNDAASRARQT